MKRKFKTKHTKIFIKDFKKDLRAFFGVFNPFNHFTSIPKSLGIIFLIMFFPQVIMIWYAIKLYRYAFIYIFMVLDIIILDIISNKIINKIYVIFYKICFYIFYYPIFRFVPIVYAWILHKFSFEFWLPIINFLMNIPIDIVAFFLRVLLRIIIFLCK